MTTCFPFSQYSLLQRVVETCQKKSHCKFPAAPGRYGEADPCPDKQKFVEVAYKCRPCEYTHTHTYPYTVWYDLHQSIEHGCCVHVNAKACTYELWQCGCRVVKSFHGYRGLYALSYRSQVQLLSDVTARSCAVIHAMYYAVIPQEFQYLKCNHLQPCVPYTLRGPPFRSLRM